jgi:hypothetical protein
MSFDEVKKALMDANPMLEQAARIKLDVDEFWRLMEMVYDKGVSSVEDWEDREYAGMNPITGDALEEFRNLFRTR